VITSVNKIASQVSKDISGNSPVQTPKTKFLELEKGQKTGTPSQVVLQHCPSIRGEAVFKQRDWQHNDVNNITVMHQNEW